MNGKFISWIDSNNEQYILPRISNIYLHIDCFILLRASPCYKLQVLKRLKKIHADDRQQQKLVEVSCGTIDHVHTHHSRHCLDFISGNGDDSVHPTKLKMLHQLDANIMEDEFASSQKHNGCNYLSPSVELGPKRLKILGPSFPRGNHELEISCRFQEDSDLASHHARWSITRQLVLTPHMLTNISLNFWKLTTPSSQGFLFVGRSVGNGWFRSNSFRRPPIEALSWLDSWLHLPGYLCGRGPEKSRQTVSDVV